ncbi:MAG TPA: hypothetical protein VID70_10085 [Solirubrobacteraceae bacterium]
MDTFPDLGALSDPELKDLIKELSEEEVDISYKRRILHGKIDILRAELVARLQRSVEAGEGAGLGADLERLTHMNRLVGLLPPARLAQNRLQLHHVDALVLAPSIDLGALSLRYADRLPAGVRALLRGFGSTRGSGANLLSYLLFDAGFCRALLRQGYRDTLARRDEIVPFLDPRRNRLVPLNWEQLS